MERTIIRHEPGIYFNLPDDEYFADDALGYSDLKRLLISGADYWYSSSRNPKRPDDEDTKARLNGHALHTCILFGREAFDQGYDCAIDKADFPDALITADDLKSALRMIGLSPSGTKPELIARLKNSSTRFTIWDDLIDAQKRTGRKIIDIEEYNRIIIAAEMIRLNPSLKNCFENGAPEVSIFWENEGGVRLRARIDYLRLKSSIDLKSFSNMMDRPIEVAIRAAIFNRRYDLQASHYLNARHVARGMIRDGRVFGDIDRDWLNLVAAEDEFIFTFVFHTIKGAPIMRRWDFYPGSMVDGCAAADVAKAIQRFKTYRDHFGDEMWCDIEEPHVIVDDDIPAWVRSSP